MGWWKEAGQHLLKGLTLGSLGLSWFASQQALTDWEGWAQKESVRRARTVEAPVWEALRRLGNGNLKRLTQALKATPLPGPEFLRYPEVVLVLQASPQGDWKLWWRQHQDPESPVSHLSLKSPSWEKKAPWAVMPKRPNGVSMPWTAWTRGKVWPGWSLGLCPSDLSYGHTGALTRLQLAWKDFISPPSLPKSRISLHRLHGQGLGFLVLGKSGLLPPPGDPRYVAIFEEKDSEQFLLHNVVLPYQMIHPAPFTAQAWGDSLYPSTFAGPFLLEPPSQSGPGGTPWPSVALVANHAGAWEDARQKESQRRGWWLLTGISGLLSLLFGIAWLRGGGRRRSVQPAVALAVLALAWVVTLACAFTVAGHLLPESVHLSAEAKEVLFLRNYASTWEHPDAWVEWGRLLAALGTLWLLSRLASRQWQTLWEAGGAEFSASALAAGVAHELRTPVAALRVDLELLAHDLAPEAELPSLKQRLLRSLGRLEHRLEEVMAFARLSEGHRAATEPYQPGALAEAAIAEAEPLLLASGSSVTLAGEAPEGPWYGDPAALRRALVELLTNATKHAPGPLVLELSPKGWALRDHGPGLPKELRRRAFEPFVRGEAKAQGAGLGLALVRATALAHHGLAWAEPAEGGGTRMHLQVRPKG